MNAPVAPEIYLASGDFHFGGGDVRLRTVLGTCVALTFWHPRRALGGMCHCLLPSRGSTAQSAGGKQGLYVDEAMDLFADALHATNTTPAQYTVKIFGGGNMFLGQPLDTQTIEVEGVQRSVGGRNVDAARRLLGAAGFQLAAEDVGGYGSRQLVFDLSCGDVWVKRGAAMPSSSAA
jgi:chemotaxis protein CheD